MCILASILLILPMTVSAHPDTQSAFLADYNQNINQEDLELNSSTEESSQPGEMGQSTSRIQEYVFEMEFEKLKLDNLEETREAVAEDIIFN